MVNRRWLKIGSGIAAGTTTIVGIFILLSLTYHFQIIDLTGNISCEGSYLNPCISEFDVKNPNSFYVDIYSKDQVRLDFSSRIRDWALFVADGRCSATGQCACILRNGQKLGFNGWRCVDFTNQTKPRADKEYIFRFDKYSTTKFRLAGIKYHSEDNIKWSFEAMNETLDPVWLPFNRTRTNIEYTRSSEKTCNESLCTLTLYSGAQYVFEDQQWKTIDHAKSLKNKGFYIKYLEKDPGLNLEIIDFNYTSIQVRLNVSDKYNQVPIRVLKDRIEKKKKDLTFSKGENKIETFDFDIYSQLKFGDNSTTIVLQTADTENLEDSWYFATGTVKNGADTDLDVLFGTAANRTAILKYDISSIPSNQDILSANISFFITLNELDATTEGFNLSAHRVYPSYAWDESTISGSIKPQPGTDFNVTASGKFRAFGGTGEPTGWQEINLTSAIQQDYADGADNSSFIIQGLDKFGAPGDTDLISFASKENSNTTRRPKLTITYQEAAVFNPNVTECMSLDIGNKVYLLQNNIQDSVGDCIVINGNNITFDGQGHIINFSLGPDEPFDIVGGIRVKNHNAVIKNVTVTTYDDYLAGNGIGIWIDSYGAGFSIENATIQNANVDGGGNFGELYDIEGKNHRIINSYATNPDQFVFGEYQSSNVLWENITYDVGYGGSFGALSLYESNNSVIRNLRSNDGMAIFHVSEGDNVRNATIINSNLSSGSVNLEAGTDYVFINTTYGAEAVNGGNLTRKWYFGFQINDSNTNQGISSASWILNDTNGQVASGTTNANGYQSSFPVISYTNISGVTNNKNPQIIQTTKTGYVTNTTSFTLNTNTFLQLWTATLPNVSGVLNLPQFQFGICGPDFENASAKPLGQSASAGVINLTNIGGTAGIARIKYTGSLNTGWKLYAANSSQVQLQLSSSSQNLVSLNPSQTQMVWMYANCSYVHANPGVNIDFDII